LIALLTSIATYGSIPRMAKSDADAFSSDLSVKPLLIKTPFNPSAMSS